MDDETPVRKPRLLRAATSKDAAAFVYEATGPRAALILAHGAGAGQRSAFIVAFARGIAARGVDVVTFDFPYITAGRRVPDRGPALEAFYRSIVAVVRADLPSAGRFLFIGGKSMGGRIATQIAAGDRDLPVAGLVLLGYPLHPPGRPNELRAAHLPSIGRPMLFVQGSRDNFGTPAELEPVIGGLVPRPMLHVVNGGDHSLKLSRRDPRLQQAADDEAQQTVIRWIDSFVDH
jgi:uncharacterized protein